MLTSRARHAWPLLLLTFAGATAGALSLAPAKPAYVWNTTPSIPVGLYKLEGGLWRRSDLVAVRPTGEAYRQLKAFGALREGQLLLKRVAAVSGDVVCRTRQSVTINGEIAAVPRTHAGAGRALPNWRGCQQLQEGWVLLLAEHAASFDGRYFGPTPASDIIGPIEPLVTTGAACHRLPTTANARPETR